MRKYITKEGKSYNSFISCLHKEDFSTLDLNYRSVLQFLRFGALYFDETFITTVKKEFTHQELELDKHKGFMYLNRDHILKPLNVGQQSSADRFLNFFEERKDFLKEKKISVDLTGGIDSRLVASILSFFEIPYDSVFSLGSGNMEEAEIAMNVSEKLGVKLAIISPKQSFKKDTLSELFILSDGLWDMLNMNSLKYTQQFRRQNGSDLVITGVGGELYKDFWWQQDFPLYGLKNPDFSRLINTRMSPFKLKREWMGAMLQEVFDTNDSWLLKKLEKYKVYKNIKAYDHIYYNVRIKEQVSVFTNASKKMVEVYSPLLEHDLLDIGYNLGVTKRVFNNFHREIITKINPEVAKLPTTEGGITVSNKLANIGPDIIKYLITKSRKAISKASGKEIKNDTLAIDIEVEKELNKSIQTLKEVDIFSKKIPEDVQQIPKLLYGRILSLGRVLSLIN